MKIVWTKEALEETKTIYEYYKSNISVYVAKRIKEKILSSTKNLHKYPNQGQIEELLNHKDDIFRYLIVDNYKIIYKISEKIIYIIKIFDCRRNPELINRVR